MIDDQNEMKADEVTADGFEEVKEVIDNDSKMFSDDFDEIVKNSSDEEEHTEDDEPPSKIFNQREVLNKVEMSGNPISTTSKEETEKHDYSLSLSALTSFLGDVDQDLYLDIYRRYQRDDGITEKELEWMLAVQRATSIHPKNDLMNRSVLRDSAVWKQDIVYQGAKIRPGKITNSAIEDQEELEGERASRKVISITSGTGLIQWPLWKSGIWVDIAPPILDEYVDLDERIRLIKDEVGGNTYGLAFSNDTVYTKNAFLDFAMQWITATNVSTDNIDDFKALIKDEDIGQLAIGIQMTINLKGYPFSQPCTGTVDCTHVSKKMINLRYLTWVDDSRLSDAQRKHMAGKLKKVKVEDIKAYQEGFIEPETKTASIYRSGEEGEANFKDVTIVLNDPTAVEAITSGNEWASMIGTMMTKALGTSPDPREKRAYLDKQIRASRLLRYSHWVKELIITENEKQAFVRDRTTIINELRRLAFDDEISNKIITSILNYANDSAVHVIGIPNEPCEACGVSHITKDGPFKAIIPFDALSAFFTLLRFHTTQKLRRDIL